MNGALEDFSWRRPLRGWLWPLLIVGLLLTFLGHGAAPILAEEGFLSVEAGFNGAARQGGLLPVRAVVVLPGSASRAPGSIFHLVLTPRGGPWNWQLILPFADPGGESIVLETVLPMHPLDRSIRVGVEDSQGSEILSRELRPAWLPSRLNLALHLGPEQGIRHFRTDEGSPQETAWIRLPSRHLIGLPAAYHDIAEVGWEEPGSPAWSALQENALQQWRTAYGRKLGPLGGQQPSTLFPPALSWNDVRKMAAAGAGKTTSISWMAIVAFLLLLMLLSIPVRAEAPLPHRILAGMLAVSLAVWIALGTPVRREFFRQDLRFEEKGPGSRSWSLMSLQEGWQAGDALTWPGSGVQIVGPGWLQSRPQPWRLIAYQPGMGRPLWEVLPPEGGGVASWIGLSFESPTDPGEGGSDLLSPVIPTAMEPACKALMEDHPGDGADFFFSREHVGRFLLRWKGIPADALGRS